MTQFTGSPPPSSNQHRDRTRKLVFWVPRHIVTQPRSERRIFNTVLGEYIINFEFERDFWKCYVDKHKFLTLTLTFFYSVKIFIIVWVCVKNQMNSMTNSRCLRRWQYRDRKSSMYSVDNTGIGNPRYTVVNNIHERNRVRGVVIIYRDQSTSPGRR